MTSLLICIIINNLNDKKKEKKIVAVNDHGQSFWFKQTQFVVYKFDTICGFLLNRLPVCFNIFVLLFPVTLYLAVAFQPWMEWITVLKIRTWTKKAKCYLWPLRIKCFFSKNQGSKLHAIVAAPLATGV